jgi:hypothetical protein
VGKEDVIEGKSEREEGGKEAEKDDDEAANALFRSVEQAQYITVFANCGA